MWRGAPTKAHNDSGENTNLQRSSAYETAGPRGSAEEAEKPHGPQLSSRFGDVSKRTLPSLRKSFEPGERIASSTPLPGTSNPYLRALPEAREREASERLERLRSDTMLPTPGLPPARSMIESRSEPFTSSFKSSEYPSRPSALIAESRMHPSGPGPARGLPTHGSYRRMSPSTSRRDVQYSPSAAVGAIPSLPPPRASPMSIYESTTGRGSANSHASSTTQYMTVETAHGQMSIPVDVQGASRVADEKRRRNAGASARFRARRKEREMASGREISDLKQRVTDLSEDCDFYRQERDILAAALYQSTDGSRLFPRPTSPRRRRSLYDNASRSESSQEPPMIQRFEEKGQQGNYGSVSRRRLDTPPQATFSYSAPSSTRSTTQGPYQPQTSTLPPIQAPQPHHDHSNRESQDRSASYPGYANYQSQPPSPWRSGYPSQAHSRSQSSTRSHQSGTSIP